MWKHLIDGIVACQYAGVAPQGDLLPITIHLWSLVHGLASLWVSGSLRFAPPEGGGIEGLTDMVLRNAGRDLALAARAESSSPHCRSGSGGVTFRGTEVAQGHAHAHRHRRTQRDELCRMSDLCRSARAAS